MGDPQEVRTQNLHHAAAHMHFLGVATPHLAVDLQSNLDFVRHLDYSTLGLRQEGSKRGVLGCCWQNMAEGERRCIELGRGLAAVPLLPSPFPGRVSDQGGDVGVL